MVTIRVEATIRGLNQYTKKLSPEALFSSVRRSLQETLEDLQGLVVNLTPEASGDTRESIFWDIDGATVSDLNGRVFSTSGHFATLEYGRTPGSKRPPARAIEAWINAVGIDALESSMTTRDLAFLIARRIGERGLPALRIMHRALEIQRPHFGTVFMRRWIEDWRR